MARVSWKGCQEASTEAARLNALLGVKDAQIVWLLGGVEALVRGRASRQVAALRPDEGGRGRGGHWDVRGLKRMVESGQACGTQ